MKEMLREAIWFAVALFAVAFVKDGGTSDDPSSPKKATEDKGGAL